MNRAKWHVVSYSKVAGKGRSDGRDWRWSFWPPKWPFRVAKQSDPPLRQQDATEYEELLIKAALENLDRLAKEWAENDKRLLTACRAAQSAHTSAKALSDATSTSHTDAQSRYLEAEQNLDKLPAPHIGPTLHHGLLVLISLAEAVFNMIVFKVLGMENVHTVAFGLAFAGLLVWITHWIGSTLQNEKKRVRDWWAMGIAVVAVLGLFGAVAFIREKFFEASEIVETLGIKWDPEDTLLVFYVINFGMFVGLVLLSYAAAHKDPEAYKRARKEHDASLRTHKQEAGNAAAATAKHAGAINPFHRAHVGRVKSFEAVCARANEERGMWISHVQAYRAANMEARTAKEKPDSFKTDLDHLITIPKLFQSDLGDCETCSYKTSGLPS